MKTLNLQKIIIEALKDLPQEKLKVVADFITSIRERNFNKNSPSQNTFYKFDSELSADETNHLEEEFADYKKLYKAHLIVIDDIMMIAIARHDANAFFHFINALHEKTSFIITTNKSPKEWAETIGDEVITTALLDRLLYRCEIIKLSGESYRMKHRKTIFEKTK